MLSLWVLCPPGSNSRLLYTEYIANDVVKGFERMSKHLDWKDQ